MDVSTVAGSGAKGSGDGQGTAATLNCPVGVAHDRHGNTFMSEEGSHRIRKMAPGGAVTTHAGSTKGHKDGPGDQAQFDNPYGMACDAEGNLFVADQGNHRIRMITPARVVTTVAGTGEEGCDDRPAAHATLNEPTDVAVHPITGDLAVADSANDRIRHIALVKHGSTVVSTLAGSTEGFEDGPSNTAEFDGPVSLDYDAQGNLHVTDFHNNRVRKVSSAHIVSTLAGTGAKGTQDGAGDQATFKNPWGVAVDGAGAVVVADKSNHRVRLISQAGATSTLAGSNNGFQDGQGTAARFKSPRAVAIDSTGGAIVADFANNLLRRIATNLAPKAWPALEIAPSPIPTFNTDMGKLLDPADGDGRFHDVSFQIEGDIIHAHKNILSARCEHFSTMLSSGFTEGASGSGSGAGTPLMVADTTPAAFRALLTYLYTDMVELDDACVVDVACLSQRYLVTRLHEACVEHCKEHVSFTNAVKWLVATHTHMLEELRNALLEHTSTHYMQIEETAPATLDVLDDHPRLLRELVRFGAVTSPPAAKRHKGGN